MLKPEVKTEWLRLLRSGEYAQTCSHLRTLHGYCCLGVLCVALGADLPVRGRANHPEHGDLGIGLLNSRGLELSGLTDDQQAELAGMNDDGKTFAEIADKIERTL